MKATRKKPGRPGVVVEYVAETDSVEFTFEWGGAGRELAGQCVGRMLYVLTDGELDAALLHALGRDGSEAARSAAAVMGLKGGPLVPPLSVFARE